MSAAMAVLLQILLLAFLCASPCQGITGTCSSLITLDGDFSLLTSRASDTSDAERAISTFILTHGHSYLDEDIRNVIRETHLQDCHADYFHWLHGPVLHAMNEEGLLLFLQKLRLEPILSATDRFCGMFRIETDDSNCAMLKDHYMTMLSSLKMTEDERNIFDFGHMWYPISFSNTWFNVTVSSGFRVADSIADTLLRINGSGDGNDDGQGVEESESESEEYRGLHQGLCSLLPCDGLPPRKVIGRMDFVMLDIDGEAICFEHIMRDGYTSEELVNQFCSIIYCDSLPLRVEIRRQVESELKNAKWLSETETEAEPSSANDQVVLIGPTCSTRQIAGNFLNLKLKKADGYLTGPFDLMNSNYEGILRCLEDDFRYFTDPYYLKLVEVPVTYDALFLTKGDRVIFNTRYNFFFVHESPTNFSFAELKYSGGINHFVDNNFELFRERYDRRIRNFYRYLSGGSRVNFIIMPPVYPVPLPHIHVPRQYPRLESLLHRKFPLLRYKITPIPIGRSTLNSTFFLHNTMMNVSHIITY